jgi:ABC-2 type transport system permease protein
MTTTQNASVSLYTGTWKLLRFNLRRDRVKFPAWSLGITMMAVYFTTALPVLFGGEEGLAETAGDFLTAGVVAIFGGPAYGFDDLTFPILFVGVYGLYILMMAALMSILMVSRHTRIEEQTGRSELVRSNVVGRMAPLTAAVVMAILANILVSLLIGAVLVGQGYEPVADSFLFGAGVGAVGLVFTGVAAVTVQLTEFSRTASGLALIVLGAAYGIRTGGDAIQEHGSVLSWFSPLAWSQQTRPFVDGRWWPLLLSIGLAAVMIRIGYALAARRDFGAGLLRVRPGPARAAEWINSPLRFAYRLHRGSFIGWSLFLLVWGFGNGAIVEPVANGLENVSSEVLAIFGGDASGIIDGYVATMGLYNAAVVGIFVVLGVLSVRSEEYGGRTEPVLATATSRGQWLGSHLIVLAIGSAILLAVSGLAMGLGAWMGMGESEILWDLTVSHLAFLPALLLFLAIAGLLYGFAPRAVGLAWIPLVYGFVIGFFAPLWDLPQWVRDLSAFEHIPEIPVEDFFVVPLLILTGVAVAVAIVALAGFRIRDLTAT